MLMCIIVSLVKILIQMAKRKKVSEMTPYERVGRVMHVAEKMARKEEGKGDEPGESHT